MVEFTIASEKGTVFIYRLIAKLTNAADWSNRNFLTFLLAKTHWVYIKFIWLISCYFSLFRCRDNFLHITFVYWKSHRTVERRIKGYCRWQFIFIILILGLIMSTCDYFANCVILFLRNLFQNDIQIVVTKLTCWLSRRCHMHYKLWVLFVSA